MKCAVFYTVALACCLGLVLADFGGMYGSSYMSGGYGAGATYVPVYPGAQGGGGIGGNGSFIGLIGMLFLLFILFGTNSNSNADQILLINSTLEG